jgi:hypothetical protein
LQELPAMVRLAVLALIAVGCDVGEVAPAGGGAVEPDAGAGGGGGGGGAAPDGGGGGGGGGGALGSLQVTFRTSQTATPQFAPANVVAVWVESSSGQFVKTIGRWANIRRSNLIAWTQKAGAMDADAISGATRTDHTQTLNLTWDMKDRQNTVVPDGTYTLRLELADRNTTAATQNNQGTFTFVKGTQEQSQNGLSGGGFSNVTIVFTP